MLREPANQSVGVALEQGEGRVLHRPVAEAGPVVLDEDLRRRHQRTGRRQRGQAALQAAGTHVGHGAIEPASKSGQRAHRDRPHKAKPPDARTMTTARQPKTDQTERRLLIVVARISPRLAPFPR